MDPEKLLEEEKKRIEQERYKAKIECKQYS